MIVERIIELIDYKGLNKRKFYLKTGLSNGFLDKVKDIGTSKIENILNTFPDVNPIWLITGEGDMIKSQGLVKNIVSEPESNYNRLDKYNTYIADVRASAGIGNIMTNRSELNNLPTMLIPNAPNGLNISFQITGESMHPTVRHLDYVVATKIDSPNEIREGFVYVIIDKDDGVLLKRIYKQGEDYSIISDNPDYPPYTRSKYDIIAFFKAFLRMSSDFAAYHDDIKKDVNQLKEDMGIIKSKLLK